MLNRIRLAGISEDSIIDGPGIRLVFFTQGCDLHCPGCHNPKTWELNGGEIHDIFDLRKKWKHNPLLDGITISGGEPTLQKEAVLRIILLAKEDGLNVVLYSGYTFENLASRKDPIIDTILLNIDYLIDGPFMIEKRSLNLAFRGSLNQRIIDIRKTLLENHVVVLER